jgi:hypothetical protein
MSFTPTVGQVAIVKITLGAGGATDWVGPGITAKADLDGKVVDKSNFRDGRIKNATLPDATVTLTLVYDQADSPFKTGTGGAQITLGATGTLKYCVDATHYFGLPVIVQTIGLENPGMEDDLMCDVEFGLNGSITYPAGV